jgi:hypothetical protein
MGRQAVPLVDWTMWSGETANISQFFEKSRSDPTKGRIAGKMSAGGTMVRFGFVATLAIMIAGCQVGGGIWSERHECIELPNGLVECNITQREFLLPGQNQPNSLK